MAPYPDVELDIDRIDRVVDIVEEGHDLAVRISRRGSATHAARKLASSRKLCCAARLVPLLPGFYLPDTDVLAVYPSRRHLNAKVRVMIDFLAQELGDTPSWDAN